MLWTVRHLWAAGSRFAFNCYRHSAQLLVRREGDQPCATILSQEGVTQGDSLSMVLYGLVMVPLAQDLQEYEPTVVQPWYADAMAMVRPISGISRVMKRLQLAGPAQGY